MIARIRAIAVLGLLVALAAGCNGDGANGNGVVPPVGGVRHFRVGVRTDGLPAEKVDALVDEAVALIRRRLTIEGYSSFRVERAEGSSIALAIAGEPREEDLRLLVGTPASLAFRVVAGLQELRGAVYPRKAPVGYRWFTRPVDPCDVVAGASYGILAEDRPTVGGEGAILAETSRGVDGTEVIISLAPAAIAALQTVLARSTQGTRVAITVNDVVVAAPQLGTRIDGSDVTLSGGYDEEKARAIAAGLNAAIIPPRLELLTEQALGPPTPDIADARR